MNDAMSIEMKNDEVIQHTLYSLLLRLDVDFSVLKRSSSSLSSTITVRGWKCTSIWIIICIFRGDPSPFRVFLGVGVLCFIFSMVLLVAVDGPKKIPPESEITWNFRRCLRGITTRYSARSSDLQPSIPCRHKVYQLYTIYGVLRGGEEQSIYI